MSAKVIVDQSKTSSVTRDLDFGEWATFGCSGYIGSYKGLLSLLFFILGRRLLTLMLLLMGNTELCLMAQKTDFKYPR